MRLERVFAIKFASLYPAYVKKVQSKGRTTAELDLVLRWLTGHTPAGFKKVLASDQDLQTFFAKAPKLNPHVSLVTGVVCGVRVEDVEDPLMKKIRIMDRLVDELAKGRALEKILRKPVA